MFYVNWKKNILTKMTSHSLKRPMTRNKAKFHIIFRLFSVFLKLKDLFYKEMALSIFLFQIISFTDRVVFNPTMLVYFWFVSGFIYLLPVLENKEIKLTELE